MRNTIETEVQNEIAALVGKRLNVDFYNEVNRGFTGAILNALHIRGLYIQYTRTERCSVGTAIAYPRGYRATDSAIILCVHEYLENHDEENINRPDPWHNLRRFHDAFLRTQTMRGRRF